VLQASNLAIEERGTIRERIERPSRPTRSTRREARAEGGKTSQESFLNHYFKRLNPDVAATFTPQQRDAIMAMFGARGIAKHTLEVRRSIPFGRRRFYLVFLMGPEQRQFVRLHGQGATSPAFNVLFYLGAGALILAPILGLLLYGTGF
jgi:hypothetical protein